MEQCNICQKSFTYTNSDYTNYTSRLCGECSEMVRELTGAYRVMTQEANTEKVVKELQKRYFVQTPLGEMEVEKPNTWERR